MTGAESPTSAVQGSARDREIVAAKVIVTCPGRNFVTLKIETRSGVFGLGDATLNGRELAVASYLQDHLVPNLIGRDAGRIEDIWQFFYRGAYWRRGPVTMTAIAAVDVALWDILAKMANMPLYQMLGGRSREGALVYGHANGSDIQETTEEVGRYIEKGYIAIRAQCGVPGLQKAYGISNLKTAYEPAESELPLETVWSTTKYLNIVPKLFEKLRVDHGPQIELLHDGHHRMSPIEAARLGRDLEPYRLFWLEDATPADNQRGFEWIRKHTVTPLAVGEVFSQSGTASISSRINSSTTPHDDRACRRHHAPASHRRFLCIASSSHWLSRGDRSFARVHGRCAALRYMGAELRYPGIHATCADHRRSVPQRLPFRERAIVLRRESPGTA